MYRLGAVFALLIAIAYFRSEKVSFGVSTTTPEGQWSPSPHRISISGVLRPSGVRPLPIYSDYQNTSVVINGRTLKVAEGSVKHVGLSHSLSEFAVLPTFVTSKEVDAIMGTFNSPTAAEFDIDPDPVDGMSSSYRFYIDGDSLTNDGQHRWMMKKNATKGRQKERTEVGLGL